MSHMRAVSLEGGYVVKRTPGRVHASFDSAAAEAVRLTEQTDGPAFLVLKVVGAVIADPAHGERYRDSDIDPDAATGCADDQMFAGLPADAVRQVAEGLRS